MSIDYANLSREAPTLDQALYVASCFVNSAPNRTVTIFGTNDPAYSDPDTGEGYRVVDGDPESIGSPFISVFRLTGLDA